MELNPRHTHKRLYRQVLIGAVIWILYSILAQTSLLPLSGEGFMRLISLLLMFAPLVTVPLALSLVQKSNESHSSHYVFIAQLQLPAAVAATLSFAVTEGTVAALLTLPWLVETVAIALLALRRFVDRRTFSLQQSAIDSGMAYIAVGGVWLTISRAGIAPLDFVPVIVLLTAVHFHYAGFAAPIIAGLTGRAIPPEQWKVRWLYNASLWSVILNPILVAIGISFSPLLELLCSVLLALGLGLLAGLILGVVVKRLEQHISRFLIAISALSLLTTMAFALLYTWGEYSGKALMHIPGMIETHGVLNVFGFALCGLAGWTIETDSVAFYKKR
ncbi:MAG: YndJ family protein [Ignavibacteriae bacterium]|nr:YndJ family protein [Ignavibacteriota bacterium]MCB9214930.1 YndJ family protein [Ignavibacteria bacterium]